RNKLSSGEPTPGKEIHISDILVQHYSALKQSTTTIVMVPGLHPHGIHDRRFRTLATILAEAGFHVLATDIPEFRSFEMTTSVLRILPTVLNRLENHVPEQAFRNLGMLSISYGAGPVFEFASNRKVDFIVSIGGYCDLAQTLKFSLTSAESWGR